jgi:hypothetical protein
VPRYARTYSRLELCLLKTTFLVRELPDERLRLLGRRNGLNVYKNATDWLAVRIDQTPTDRSD